MSFRYIGIIIAEQFVVWWIKGRLELLGRIKGAVGDRHFSNCGPLFSKTGTCGLKKKRLKKGPFLKS